MAQAILLEDVENVGEKGDVVDVAPGYLRNFLVPRKLAASATKGSLEQAKKRQEAQEVAAGRSANQAWDAPPSPSPPGCAWSNRSRDPRNCRR